MYVYYNRKERRGLKTFLTIVATAIITTVIIKLFPNVNLERKNTIEGNNGQRLERIETNIQSAEKEEDSEENNFINIIEENMQSVVGISVLKPNGDGILDFNVTQKWGIGTGIVLSKKGYVLTNQHLASNLNSTVTVTLETGEEVKGKTIWNEPNLDLAIIKIDENSNLKPIKVGSASNSKIGEEVIAIGNPLGIEFQKSVTKGVVSGLNRTLKVEDENSTVIMENLIQTDASINTGNSGGPLINKNGEVIGVNTVKITSAEGIGFAVPIDIIKPILTKLEQTGNFEEGYIGIFAYDSEIVPYLERTISADNGIYIATVNRYSPAYNAGLQVGDIILEVDENKITKMNELREYIYNKIPGDKVELKVSRNSENLLINITLGRK